MVFKRRFFLDLGGGETPQQPVTVAPVRATPAADTKAKATSAPVVAAAAPAAPAAASAAPSAGAAPSTAAEAGEGSGPSLTTAEAIAAELAAAQANRPAPSQVTFAPDCLTAGGALSQRRRRGGADLAGFKEMARGMMGK